MNITYALELAGGITTGSAFSFSGNVNYGALTIDGSLECGTGGSLDYYSGGYSVTPTRQTQTLYTEGKTLAQNVVVNPIPNNYGLITWNGLSLMVS